ncbi:MAG TPA: cell division protein ZapB [bacterium]
MDYAELKKLEDNIARAVEKIQKLQQENQKLKDQNVNLLNQLREKDLIIRRLQNQPHDDYEVADEANDLQEKEGKIKFKIQQMLDKLENFQQLSMK